MPDRARFRCSDLPALHAAAAQPLFRDPSPPPHTASNSAQQIPLSSRLPDRSGCDSRQFLCCLCRRRKLFLFEQKICLLCVCRAYGVDDRPTGCTSSNESFELVRRAVGDGAGSGRRSGSDSGGCRGRGLVRCLARASGPGRLGLNRRSRQEKNRPDADKTLNKRRSTHNAHDCIRERVGLKAQTNVEQPSDAGMRALSCAAICNRFTKRQDAKICFNLCLCAFAAKILRSSASTQTGTAASRRRRLGG